MKLKGRYVPDSIVEIPMGEGVTQLVYEPIKCFDINREKVVDVEVKETKRNKRDWILWSTVAATFFCGTALGGMVQHIYYCIPMFIISLAYIGMVIYANK